MIRESPVPAALVALAAAVLIAVPARSALQTAQVPHLERPAFEIPALETAADDGRLRALVSLIDRTRARAAAPGLTDEERDALAEMAWAQADEALEDPSLRARAQRDPDFLQAQALLLMDESENGEALAVLERLTVLAPEDPETHRLLGLDLVGLGRAEGAIAAYRRALELNVDDAAAAEVRAHLARALVIAGRLEEGLAESEGAIAQDPSDYYGHVTRGWILGIAGRRDEERREYLEAVQWERDDADLWELLAQSWERIGDADRARDAWREVARIDPSDEKAAERIGARP